MKRPELLSPAGDPERLRFAIAYGADAVYLSGKRFGMRSAPGNFSPDELRQAAQLCRAAGVRMYVTVNTLPRDSELDALREELTLLNEIGADAIIAADLGVLSLARHYAPRCEIHMSTQTSIVNAEAARMYHELGASRVVLARELSLEEIAALRARAPRELELEVFVHGSMCMAYSGRCMLSSYLAGRDANRGACAQPCRWQYRVEEEYRPGEYMPVEEDGHGTYIFNSKDMNLLPRLDEIIALGVDSLKLEGRAKTAYYAAVITNAYRRGIDLCCAGGPYAPPRELLDEPMKVSHREYFTGFYFGDPRTQHTEDSSYIREWDICAVVEECDGEGRARLRHKNRFAADDAFELLVPGRPAQEIRLAEMRSETGEPLELANVPHMTVYARLPFCVPPLSILRRKK